MSIKYTIWIGYFSTKEIIRSFPTSITTPQEKKKFYPITSNPQEGNNNNNNNRVPKWLLYTCVYFVY
jgi:hypothetical protein